MYQDIFDRWHLKSQSNMLHFLHKYFTLLNITLPYLNHRITNLKRVIITRYKHWLLCKKKSKLIKFWFGCIYTNGPRKTCWNKLLDGMLYFLKYMSWSFSSISPFHWTKYEFFFCKYAQINRKCGLGHNYWRNP